MAVWDRRGRLLFRARASDISENGLRCLTLARRALRAKGKVVLELCLPPARLPKVRHRVARTVRYLGRIVQAEEVGQLVGVAIQLIEKLD